MDDNSPDGTAGVVARLAAADPRVHLLLRRTDRGFGLAVRDWLRGSPAHGAPLIGQMDADGSHDPATLPALYASASRGQRGHRHRLAVRRRQHRSRAGGPSAT